ncbi:MAG: WGR domain-containing protein [Candidatus Lokiarchaeota archaeon]|nr:WGR domain-containing protein [Candidatus Lokiarchaeota archaeon]
MSNIITIEDLEKMVTNSVIITGDNFVSFYDTVIETVVKLDVIKYYLAHNTLEISNKYYEMYVTESKVNLTSFLICRYGRVGSMMGAENIIKSDFNNIISKFYDIRVAKTKKGYVEYTKHTYKNVVGNLHNASI